MGAENMSRLLNYKDIGALTGQTIDSIKEKVEDLLQGYGLMVRQDLAEVIDFYKCWQGEDPDDEPFDETEIRNDDWEEHDYYDNEGEHYKIRIDSYYYRDPGVPSEDYVYIVSVF